MSANKLVSLIALLLTLPALADSPLTSTGIHLSYSDVSAVQKAVNASGRITDEIVQFLISDENPTDQKIAVVTALGWSTDGQDNAPKIKEALKTKYQTNNIDFDARISAVDSMIYGFTLAHDDYFKAAVGGTYTEAATKKDPTNKTLEFVDRLVEAQVALSDADKWCFVYKNLASMKPHSALRHSIRRAAIDNVMAYIKLYKDSCTR